MKKFLALLALCTGANAQIKDDLNPQNIAYFLKCGEPITSIIQRSNEMNEYLFMTLDIKMNQRVNEYMKQIWLLNPQEKTATIVFTKDGKTTCHTTAVNVLIGPVVVPEKRIIYPAPVVNVKQ